MGGTSSDCALIPGAVPAVRRETVIGTLSVKAPSIDVHTVGAGGGSIAKFSALTKNLRVGPESAGASPGPACYGKGGREPTVTDANLVLGYLPSTLLGGDFKLDLEAAASVVGSLAAEMGMTVHDAAQGIVDLVNETMYGAVRVVSIEQGYDPKDFAIVVFGGAGPLHANAVGELLGSWPVIIPPSPGILCAQGDVVTKMSHEKTSSYIQSLSALDLDEFKARFHGLQDLCHSKLVDSSSTAPQTLKTDYQVDLRYMGQSQEMTVGIEEALLKSDIKQVQDALREKFEIAHHRRFTFVMPQYQIELIRLRVIASDDSAEVQLTSLADTKGSLTPPASAIISRKNIYHKKQKLDAIIWDRKAISVPGMTVHGPCVISEMDSNTLVLPGYVAKIDQRGNIIINPDLKAAVVEDQQSLSTEAAKQRLSEMAIIPTLVSSALSSIRREMDTLVLRASMSPGIREQQVRPSPCPIAY